MWHAHRMADQWGWAGTVEAFLEIPAPVLLESLEEHHARLMHEQPSSSQRAAWASEHAAMTQALRDVAIAVPEAGRWSIVFEYELPMEGGRRPDVVVLAGDAVVVLEFKESGLWQQSFVDQVQAYASDLAEYHGETHGREVIPILVLAGSRDAARVDGDVVTTTPGDLSHYLVSSYRPGTIDLDRWLHAPYEPLPTLVAAARRIFRDEPLPHVRRALSVGIPDTVNLLMSLIDRTEKQKERLLAFVTGVPGSGKTLVGLRVVYERSSERAEATFLSGNGPLVAVLRDALKSGVFVRDLHAFIKTYGLGDRVAQQHVIVFDEAQRAWDRAYMRTKRDVDASEPQLLVRAGERVTDWAALVGLVGDGQEIHSGEEAGMPQWREAAAVPSATKQWKIHCPPRLASEFDGLPVETHEQLDLTVSLRSKRADEIHRWVAHLLEGSISLAARLATRIQSDAYPMYLTRDIDDARAYVRNRFEDEPERRYGLLASSHDKLLRRLNPPIDNGYQATTQTMNYGRWFNGELSDPRSSLHLEQPITEFGCQGLELDLPILCWGDDYRWDGSEWIKRPIRRRYPQEDPEQLLLNSYRVLLTRGREGLVIFVPPVETLDQTEHALLAAGARPLPQPEQAGAGATAAAHRPFEELG